MKICPECGAQCADEDNFCIRCGKLLHENKEVNESKEEPAREAQSDNLQGVQASEIHSENPSGAAYGSPSAQNAMAFRKKERPVIGSETTWLICLLLTIVSGAETVLAAIQGTLSLPIIEVLLVVFAWIVYANAKQKDLTKFDGKCIGRVGGVLQAYFILEIIAAVLIAVAAAFVFSLGKPNVRQFIINAYYQGQLSYDMYATIMSMVATHKEIATALVITAVGAVYSCVCLRMFRVAIHGMAVSVAADDNRLKRSFRCYKVAIGMSVAMFILNVIIGLFAFTKIGSLEGSLAWNIIAQVLDIACNLIYLFILLNSGMVFGEFERRATSKK